MVWCGNVVMSVLLREPTSPERFARLVPTGLFVYAMWHVLKTAFKQPEEAIEWTSAERELGVRRPVRASRTDLLSAGQHPECDGGQSGVLYVVDAARLAATVGRFRGHVVGVDLSGSAADECRNHDTRSAARTYRRFRCAATAIAAAVVVSSLVIAFSTPPNWQAQSTHLTWAILRHVLAAAAELFETLPGRIALAPFQVFAYLITTSAVSAVWWLGVLVCLLTIFAMTWLMIWLDAGSIDG